MRQVASPISDQPISHTSLWSTSAGIRLELLQLSTNNHCPFPVVVWIVITNSILSTFLSRTLTRP